MHHKPGLFDKPPILEGDLSSPDRIKDYGSPASPSQKRWSEFSNETLNQLIELLPGFPDKKLILSDNYTKINGELIEQYRLLETKVGCAYLFLADRRAQIATELQHKKDSNRTDWFGMIRSETFTSFEEVFFNHEDLWENQKDKIFENCWNIIKNLKEGQSEAELTDFVIQKINTINSAINKEVVAYRIEIRSPEFGKEIEFNDRIESHSENLSEIALYVTKDFNVIKINKPKNNEEIEVGNLYLYSNKENIEFLAKTPRGEIKKISISEKELGKNFVSIQKSLVENSMLSVEDQQAFFKVAEKYDFPKDDFRIRLTYADINKHSLRGDFLLADKYLYDMEQAADNENVNEFLENAGRLSHLLAHLLLIRLGNASSVELLIKGVAKSRGLDLGHFSFKDKIGWDWMALTTPNREEYAKWYAKNVFTNVDSFKFDKKNKP